jgi:hypothetical protein
MKTVIYVLIAIFVVVHIGWELVILFVNKNYTDGSLLLLAYVGIVALHTEIIYLLIQKSKTWQNKK